MTVKLAHSKKIIETEAQIWPCEECGRVHLRAGDVLLTFAHQEFKEFTEAVAECYCHSLTLQRLSNQLAKLDDNIGILSSELSH
jgi:hypothetical protein